jgi:hypothetical protein
MCAPVFAPVPAPNVAVGGARPSSGAKDAAIPLMSRDRETESPESPSEPQFVLGVDHALSA